MALAIITDNSDENSHGNICSKVLTAENMESSKRKDQTSMNAYTVCRNGSEYFKIKDTEDEILIRLCRRMEFFLKYPIIL
jgi:hypothetical protein